MYTYIHTLYTCTSCMHACMYVYLDSDLQSGHNFSLSCFIGLNNGSSKKQPEGGVLDLGNFRTLWQPQLILQFKGVKRCDVWLIQPEK